MLELSPGQVKSRDIQCNYGLLLSLAIIRHIRAKISLQKSFANLVNLDTLYSFVPSSLQQSVA